MHFGILCEMVVPKRRMGVYVNSHCAHDVGQVQINLSLQLQQLHRFFN